MSGSKVYSGGSSLMESGGNVVASVGDSDRSSSPVGGTVVWRGRLGMENPFSLKVGQVFTGFGVGCGVGVGVGRPIYLGAIPALQQILAATRGATDILSGAGRHFNSSLRRFGVKGLEAGIGCGVGVGHGFGVGIAIKPSAIQRIQSSLSQVFADIITRFGMESAFSSLQGIIPGSLPSSTNTLIVQSDKPLQASTVSRWEMASDSAESFSMGTRKDPSLSLGSNGTFGVEEISTETPKVSRSEKVISNFLQNPVLGKENEMDISELADSLRSENNVLQVLLNHQKAIEKLVKENEKLHQILLEELKVSPTKLETDHEIWIKPRSPCSDCFECRRKRRSVR